MDNDDLPIGRILSRREALGIIGGGGLAFLAGCGGGGSSGPKTTTPTVTATPTTTATPIATSCVAKPELTEGPYFVDERLNRSDIRSNTSTGAVSQGVVLTLTFNVSQITSSACGVLAGAMVDVWHANALGKYSDISSEGTSGQNFLRGYQLTDSSGIASFTTIYPGWYNGRAVHMHYKIRITISGRTHEFTSQLFFDDALTTSVFAANAPYNTRGTRDTLNSRDNIYAQGGSGTLLSLAQSGSSYSSAFNLGIDLT